MKPTAIIAGALCAFVILAFSDPVFSMNLGDNDQTLPGLERLEEYGLVETYQRGIRPYSRVRVAHWINEAYTAKTTLDQEAIVQLESLIPGLVNAYSLEYRAYTERASLSRDFFEFRLRSQEMQLAYTYRHSPTTQHAGDVEAVHQGFAEGEEGRHLAYGGTMLTDVLLWLNINHIGTICYQPRFEFLFPGNEPNGVNYYAPRLYAKLSLFKQALVLGKDMQQWGQLEHGELLLSRNAKPLGDLESLPLIKLSSELPQLLPFGLGTFDYAVFMAGLASDRVDAPENRLAGAKLTYVPRRGVEIGLASLSLFGGEGLSSHKSTLTALDSRISIGRYAQIYGELATDALAQTISAEHMPSYGFGALLPTILYKQRLALHAEYITTHSGYGLARRSDSGFTFHDRLLGSPLGPGAKGIYTGFKLYATKQTDVATTLFHERLSGRENSGLLEEALESAYPRLVQRRGPMQRTGFELALWYKMLSNAFWRLSTGYANQSLTPAQALEKENRNNYLFELLLTITSPQQGGS